MAKKKYIFAGFGSYAKKWYSIIREHPAAEAVCVVKRTRGDVGSGDFSGLQYRESLAEAIEEYRPDFVFNLTPPVAHYAVGKAALSAHTPVLSEKPITESFRESLDLLKLRRAANVPYVISQKFRYMPWARTLRKAIEDGAIGRPQQANIYFHDSPRFWPGAYYLEVPEPFLSDYCPHSFDLIRYVFGANPARMSARSFRPEWSWFKGKPSASVWFTFRDGLEVSYSGTWVTSGRSTTQNGTWRIDGDKGTLTYEDEHIFVETGRDSRHEIPIVAQKEPEELRIFNEFLDTLDAGRRHETDIEDNIFSMHLVSESIVSAGTGKAIDLRQSF